MSTTSPAAPSPTIDANERATIRNREIGFIFQSFNLIGDLDVYQNVELPSTYRQGFSRDARRKAVMQALERVSMAHRLSHFPRSSREGSSSVSRWLAHWPATLPFFLRTSRPETWIRRTAKR